MAPSPPSSACAVANAATWWLAAPCESHAASPIVTAACTQACEYCWGPPRRMAAVGTDTALAIIDRVQAFGVRRVVFTGGDPLLRRDIVPLVRHAHDFLEGHGLCVGRNRPYAGGFITEHYGHPASHVHALQIEINRAVYMNEATFEKGPRFARLAEDLAAMSRALSDCASGLASWRAAAE